MGVLACNRRGCSNVMCDRYSSAHGYICAEDFAELELRFPEMAIEEFMKTPKGSLPEMAVAVAQLDSIFRWVHS